MKRLAWITGGAAVLALVLGTWGRTADDERSGRDAPEPPAATGSASAGPDATPGSPFRSANWDTTPAPPAPDLAGDEKPASRAARPRLRGVEIVPVRPPSPETPR